MSESKPTWSIEGVQPTLPVHDINVGIDFYGRLGFAIEWKYPDDQPTAVGLRLGAQCIMLMQCEPKERGNLYYQVDDVDACFTHIEQSQCWTVAQALRDAGQGGDDWPPERAVQPPSPPVRADYGMVDFSLVDPWGNLLTFGRLSDEFASHHKDS